MTFSKLSTQNSRKFEFDCWVNAKIFDNIFAYYDSLLPIGSDEITKSLQMWLNNPQSGHKEGENSQFFGEITIMANPTIYLKKNLDLIFLPFGFVWKINTFDSLCMTDWQLRLYQRHHLISSNFSYDKTSSAYTKGTLGNLALIGAGRTQTF